MEIKGFKEDCKIMQYEVGKLVRDFIQTYPDLSRFELTVLVGSPNVCLTESGGLTDGRLVQVFSPMVVFGSGDDDDFR